MKRYKIISFLSLIVLLFLILVAPQFFVRQSIDDTEIDKQKINSDITVFIHGTYFPVISELVNKFDFKKGFYSANSVSNNYEHYKIVQRINKLSNDQFFLDSFYFFGWSGKLSFSEREKAAQNLYDHLIKINKPITIIAHSHGCNVTLLLEKIAKKNKNHNFKINKLILLACPVQKATSNCVGSSIFKKVYSLYSKSDLVQVLDPQGLYPSSNLDSLKEEKATYLFSERLFRNCSNLTQVEILIDGKSPGHLDFIFKESFLINLPKLINVLDKKKLDKNHLIANIKSNSNKIDVA